MNRETQLRVKRAVDVVGAAAAVALRRRLGSPALFRPERAGLHGQSTAPELRGSPPPQGAP